MRRKIICLTIITLVLCNSICFGATLKKGSFVAATREIYNKMVSMAVKKDYVALAKLDQAGLIAEIPADVEVEIVKSHWGVLEVRAKGHINTVWVSSEFVK